MKKFLREILRKYKYWLYNGQTEKGQSRHQTGATRTLALVLLFAMCVSALYYTGLFDVSFISRPGSWADNFSIIWGEKQQSRPSSEDTPKPTTPVNDPSPVTCNTVQSVDLSGTVYSNRKPTGDFNFQSREELEAQGYHLSEKTYRKDSFKLGLIDIGFQLPSQYSYGTMLRRDWVVTSYDDGRMSTCEETETEVTRPAVSLYMGYMIISDEGRALYLVDRDGHILMRYDPKYIPALARNSAGKPLFYTTYSYYAEVPKEVTVDEAGDEVVVDTQGVYLTGKKYYTLSASGTYFVAEDGYTEEKDGRGLCFDYIDSYGLSDNDIIRCGIMYPKFSTYLNGTKNLTNFMKWNYFYKWDENIPDLEKTVADANDFLALSPAERIKLREEGDTPDTVADRLLPYSAAYNFSEGYAVAVTKDTGEDEKYETEEVRVLNNYSEPMFASKKSYYNTDIKDYCSDRYLLPLSKGKDSIGHLYFNNGLLRIRKVSFDQFQLDEYGDLRINSDRDVLVYPNGKEFPIPEGYELKGYSDGILLLEKDGLFGYMNTSGKWIANPEYVAGEPFMGGLGVLTSKNGRCIVMDTTGEIVIPTDYTYVSNRSEGLIAAYSPDKGWHLYGVFTK